MPESTNTRALPDFIVKWVDVGIFVINREMEITLWNNFMANHSGQSAADVVGRNLFDAFPELPKNWLKKKIDSIFILKNFAFTSWEQRPYLFRFPHNRPITGGVDFMYQNCTFVPVKNEQGEVEAVCVTLFDATDTGISQTMLKKTMAALEESSSRDGLTGIFNRRYLEQHLDSEFGRCKRYGGIFSLILFDLDHFKKVNDTYGHLAGDQVLCEVANRIAPMLRSTDVFGRYGGEEFTVMLAATELHGAQILAERLREAIAEAPIKFKDIEISVTISMGVTQIRSRSEKYEALIHEADTALYASKEGGRNKVTTYTPGLEQEIGNH